MAVIEAYIDESAKTLVGRPVCSVATFFGTHDQWRTFEQIWSPVLDMAAIPYYHGKDPKCDQLRRHMVSAIRSSGIRGCTNTLFRDEYVKGGHEFRSTIGNHYAFMAISMALHVRDWAKRTNNGPIAFVLEDGQPNVEHVLKLIRTQVPEAASVVCAGKRDFVGLQAADFLAHHSAALDVGLVRVNQLLGDGPGQVMWAHLDPKGIEHMSNGMKHLLRLHRRNMSEQKKARKASRDKRDS